MTFCPTYVYIHQVYIKLWFHEGHGLCHLLLLTLISFPVMYWLLHSSVLSHLSVLSQQKSKLLKNANSFTLTLPSRKAGSGEQGSVREMLGLQGKG